MHPYCWCRIWQNLAFGQLSEIGSLLGGPLYTGAVLYWGPERDHNLENDP